MRETGPEGSAPRIFKAGHFWNSNVLGAAVGGAGAGILMFVVMSIVVSLNPTRNNILFVIGLALVLILSAICFIPLNLIAAYPYEVLLEEGKGLQLRAPFKKIYIPIEDVRDVRKSSMQSGYVVQLNRRHRLLTSFLIPSFFGDQAGPLAAAIQTEIRRSRLLA